MSEWTQIERHSQQDPPRNKEVLVFLRENKVSALGHLYDNGESLMWWVTGWKHALPYCEVSHWMLKPDAPKGN